MNALLTSTFIMTNFLLSSVISFDSAMTGFKAEKKEKKGNSICDRQDKIKGRSPRKTSRIRVSY